MKKICFIDRNIPYSTDLFQSLSENNTSSEFEILYVCPKYIEPQKISKDFTSKVRSIWTNEKYVKEIYEFLKEENPNLIHFSFELKTFGSLMSAIKFPFLLFKVKRLKLKIVLTLHNILIIRKEEQWDIAEYNPTKIPRILLKFFLKIYLKSICYFCDKIIVGTNLGKFALIDFYAIDKKKIEVIHLGIPKSKIIEQEQIIKMNKRFNKMKIILYFGVISPRKGQENAINAFISSEKQLENYCLVIVGKAPKEFRQYEERLHKIVVQNKLTNKIHFTGFLEESEVHALFQMTKIALFIYAPMTSSTHALTYALQNNIPSIVSDIEIFHEILENGSTYFVNPNNTITISKALIELVKNENQQKKIREKMKKLAKKYQIIFSAKKYLKIYSELI